MTAKNWWADLAPKCLNCGSEKVLSQDRCEPCLSHYLNFATERPLEPRPRRTRVTPMEDQSSLARQVAAAWPGEGQEWPASGWLGVDVGFVFPAVDSDGHIYHWHKSTDRLTFGDVTQAGAVRITRPDGSTLTREPYDEEGLLDVFARARDEEYRKRLRRLASHIVKRASDSGRGVALEDWGDFKRRRAAWIGVWEAIKATAAERGVAVVTVPSAFTSQTCPGCGHVEAANRPDRNSFVCVRCGHSGQADRIAATNIRGLAERGDTTRREAAQCVNPACSRPPWKASTCLSCYFYKRRCGYFPDAATIERLALKRSAQEFLDAVKGRPGRVLAS